MNAIHNCSFENGKCKVLGRAWDDAPPADPVLERLSKIEAKLDRIAPGRGLVPFMVACMWLTYLFNGCRFH
jgi:hypothetical protein